MKSAAAKQLKVVARPSTELAELVDDYVAELRARGLAERSLDMAYGTLAKSFLPWAAERGVSTAAELDQRLLEALSRDLLERRTRKGELLSRESVRTYMRTLRGFVLWAQKRGEVSALAVPMPTAPKRVLTVLTSAEMRAMEDAAISERDKLIIALLSTTGIRLGELLALETKDVVKNRNGRGSETYLHVYGKGSRERMVPVDGRLAERLLRYARRPQAQEARTNRIFITDRKSDGAYSGLSQRAVQQLIHYAARRAKVRQGKGERVYAHLFRHSYATKALNAGMPIKHLQENLGHADLGMLTNIYSHVQPSDRYESMLALIRRDEDDRRR
jgi:integrase/recombinase XerD